MIEPWAINIDIEGFSILWDKEDQVLWSLCELMRSIFRVGWHCYPDSPERLFVHQIGDGFLVMSDFGEQSLERAIIIATALMRHVASTGRLAKAAIAEGELSDIQNCYPKEVLEKLEADHTVSLDRGLMTIFPVMGTALIRSVKLAKISPRGPLLTIEASKKDRIPSYVPVSPIQPTQVPELLSIDWVHLKSDLLKAIQLKSQLSAPSSDYLENCLSKYCSEHDLPSEWVSSVNRYLALQQETHIERIVGGSESVS